MPNRSWRVLIAALGIALAATAYAQPIGRDTGGDAPAQEGQPEPRGYPKPVSPPSVQDLLYRIASALEAANAEPETAEETERAQRDLAAQEGMAVWAKAMFWATTAGVFFTMIGIWLVWLNLREARKVTTQAVETAAAVIRSADAAAESVVEARKATEAARSMLAAERAYVFVSPHLHRKGGKTFACVTVFNLGRTPALIGRCLFHLHQLPPEQFAYMVDEDGYWGSRDMPIESGGNLLIWEREFVLDAPKSGNLWGIIEYKDVIGNSYSTRFRYWISDGGEMLHWHREGPPEWNERT